MREHDTASAKAVSFREVLRAELDEVASQRAARGAPPQPASKDGDVLQRAHAAGLVGLAFSGGGIRSATFNLGVLQGLAKLGLLPSFDYLSTVSGGGYIGSWLCSWIRRAGGIKSVQQSILPQRRTHQDHREADEIRFLRSYSNYLTPKRGALSADTWTMITTYARNLVLNLSILVLTMVALMLLPHVAVTLHFYLTAAMQWQGGEVWLLWVAFSLLLLAISVVSMNLSSPPTNAGYLTTHQRFSFSTPTIWLLVVAPILIAAWLTSAGLWVWLERHSSIETDFLGWSFSVGAMYASMWVVGWFITFLSTRVLSVSAAQPPTATQRLSAWGCKLLAALRGLAVVPGALFAGMVCGALLLALACGMLEWRQWTGGEVLVACFGLALVVVIYALTSVVHIGLVGEGFSEETREWWSRLGAVLLLTITWVAAVFAISIYGPLLVDWLWEKLQVWGSAALASGWLASSIGGALVGKSTALHSDNASRKARLIAAVAPYIFILGLLLMLAWSIRRVLPSAIQALNNWFGDFGWWQAMNTSLGAGLWPLFGVLIVVLTLSLLISWRIGINEFSLHASYRNRLVRCYLGASNRERHPNAFTGFDPADDAATMSAFSTEAGYRGPYLIVNAALNLVRGGKLAWQSRKAASFVFTPRYCGYDFSSREGKDPRYLLADHGYRPSKQYGGGVTLGTAMAISGAAASPNMGYHSSPAVAFLMTVFNVRLGWWLGNPRRNWTWRRSGPRLGIHYLIRELLGLTNDRSSYVYLSDGGHFENLALYELVRRRCKYIVAFDADEDCHMKFGDLGSAIERIRADFGINISIDVTQIRPPTAGYSKCYCAIGRIHYSDVDEGAPDGWLVFVKSSCTGKEPMDVTAYRSQYPAFPHQSTADQWFDEAQFESYRALGEHVALEVLCDAKGTATPNVERALQDAIKRWSVAEPTAA